MKRKSLYKKEDYINISVIDTFCRANPSERTLQTKVKIITEKMLLDMFFCHVMPFLLISAIEYDAFIESDGEWPACTYKWGPFQKPLWKSIITKPRNNADFKLRSLSLRNLAYFPRDTSSGNKMYTVHWEIFSKRTNRVVWVQLYRTQVIKKSIISYWFQNLVYRTFCAICSA